MDAVLTEEIIVSRPLRLQVWEPPEIRPTVTECRQHRLVCSCCGGTTCGELLQGKSAPGLLAYYRQNKRRAAEFLGTLLAGPRPTSLTVKIQHQVPAAARLSYEALAAELPNEEQLNIDGTPTKEQGGEARLGTFVARKTYWPLGCLQLWHV